MVLPIFVGKIQILRKAPHHSRVISTKGFETVPRIANLGIFGYHWGDHQEGGKHLTALGRIHFEIAL